MTDLPSRLAAALADRYRLERELGQGGMATVYLAADLRHDRRVAVKVLRPELAAVLGAERFVVEIKTTAALQHPHILPLFDSGTAGGFLYYVMPYVAGETLRNKLDRETQLGIDEAVKLTVAVADALDYAHRQGVIHRDIKPENILLHDGRPMVADFGIALALSAAAGGRMTETGLSLGTPHYMSPEQATAEKEITARSDVYSLGAVLYEMLTGNPPHTGASAQQIIMKIVTEEAAPVTKLRKAVPPHVAAAVATAVEKLPADRFASAADFARALENTGYAATAVGSAHGARHPPSRRPAVQYLSWALVLAATVLAAWLALRPQEAAPVSRQRVVLWRHALENFLSPGIERHATQAAIAPDGSSIVFSDSVGGTIQLFRKPRDQGEAVPMAGTERAVSPFFSPDGAWVGYLTTDGKLRKVPAGGGGSITIAENADRVYSSAAWMEDGTIVYIDETSNLRRIPADGGPGTILLSDTSNQRRTIPLLAPLPRSRGVLVTTCPGNCSISAAVSVFDFATGSLREVVPDAAGAWYAPTGHLLYTGRNGGLYAVGFDLERLEPRGGAVPMIEDVAPASFALSRSGSILYSLGGGAETASALVWVSRDGRSEPLDPGWRGGFEYPALSPDGRSVAVSVREGTTQLWIWRADGTRQKLTQEGTVNWRPSWTPDGRSVAFASNRRGGSSQDDFDLYLAPVDGSAPAELLHRHPFGLWEVELSRDGEWLVLRADENQGDANLHARRLAGDTALLPLVVDEHTTTQATLSPGGGWLAFVSNATGEREVYVTAFPGGGSTRLVSRDGGTEPRWAHSGRELFYKSRNQLMVVPVTPGPTLVTGVPRPLFPVAGYHGARNRQEYDVAPDDQRFLMIQLGGAGARAEAIHVENWFAELRAKVRR
ncbi:MAG TPA: LpqB family beta-propeller domain-containing protein [Gemmatimonadales bacterium]|nr:LpqB family beta-propeller domain-containing protein [Gemmatimonadales bacterium]